MDVVRLARNQEASVLAGTQGALDLLGAPRQMRRLLGSLGGGGHYSGIRRIQFG